jgi:hypothetical protein
MNIDQKSSRKKGQPLQLAVLILVILFGGGLLLFEFADDSEPASEQPQQLDAIVVEEEVQQDGTPEEKIQAVVSAELAGNNNRGVNYLRKVDTIPQADGESYRVQVELNAPDGFSAAGQRDLIEEKMARVYKALYTGDLPLDAVFVRAYYPLQDTYGNVEDAVIYGTKLDVGEATKINWGADEAVLVINIIPDVWEVVKLHPDFK